MAIKKITRTVKVYEYTTGKFNAATMTVENMRKTSFPYKLGQRELRQLEKQTGGQVLGQPVETETLYGMTLETFIKYATPIDADDSAADDSTENA